MAGKMKKKNIGGNDVWVDTETGEIKHYEPSYTSSGKAADRNIPAGVPTSTPLGQKLTQQASENAQLSQLEDATVDPGKHENEVEKAKARAAAYTNIPEGTYTNKQLIEKMNNPTMDKIAESKIGQTVGDIRNEANKKIETALEENLGIPQSGSYVPNASEQAIAEESEEQKLADAENRAQREETIKLQHDIQDAERKALQEGGDPELAKMQAKDEIDQTKAPSGKNKDSKGGEKSSNGDGGEGGGETPSVTTENKRTDWKSIYDEYMGPKNGADYVKALWNNGEYGKAVGNVLGNLLGSLGTINVGGASTGGRDFHSDWEDYRTNYTQAQKERNQTAFNNGMDLLKRAEMNQQDLEKQAGMNELDLSKREAMNTQDLDFLQKEVDKKLNMSKDLSAEDIALLQSFNTALGAGGVSAALASLSSKGIARIAEILGW